MPNHIHQRLSVFGTPNNVAAFVATAMGAPPMTGDKEGAYRTKPAVVDMFGARATYDFTCAWDAPLRVFERVSLRYRVLKFFLSWGGEGPIRGRASFQGGKMTYHRADDYETVLKPEIEAGPDPATDEDAADDHFNAVESALITTHDQWVRAAVRRMGWIQPASERRWFWYRQRRVEIGR